MITTEQLNEAREIVYARMSPTLQTPWPLLKQRTGIEVWVKHENQTPTGAFKVRGGLVLMAMRQRAGLTNGIISATRGNHGQSLPFAARQYDIPVTIYCSNGQ